MATDLTRGDLVTNVSTWREGDAVAIDGHGGVWLVTADEAEMITRNPRNAGSVRVEKVFDGAGPAHLSASAHVSELRAVEAAPTPADDERDDLDEPRGVRLTARNGQIVAPMHSAAYASIWHVVQCARHLQQAVGLDVDAHEIVWNPYGNRGWEPVKGDEARVPVDLLGEVKHNHAYFDDGVTPVVGPCRNLETCRTSLAIVETRAQNRSGQPRFAELDFDAAKVAAAPQGGDEAEYGLRYTFHGQAVESIVLTPGLAAGAHCVRLTREIQQTLGMPVDAVLIARRPATEIEIASDWREVRIEPGAVGEPGKLLAAH